MRIPPSSPGSLPALRGTAADPRAQGPSPQAARGYGDDSDFEPSEEDVAAQQSIDEMINALGSRATFKTFVKKQADGTKWESDRQRRGFERSRNALPSDALRRVQNKLKQEQAKLKAQGLSPSEIETKLDKLMNQKLNFEEENKAFFDGLIQRMKDLNPWAD